MNDIQPIQQLPTPLIETDSIYLCKRGSGKENDLSSRFLLTVDRLGNARTVYCDGSGSTVDAAKFLLECYVIKKIDLKTL